MPEAETNQTIDVRPMTSADVPFISRIVHRMHPGDTASPRDPAAMDRYFANLGTGDLSQEPGAVGFVATIGGEPAGLLTIHPDTDYFTGHARAHIDHLVVAPESEGKGVGRALLDYAEQWGRKRGCREVVLDVFATNHGALAFYERCGYRPDHIRMAKPID